MLAGMLVLGSTSLFAAETASASLFLSGVVQKNVTISISPNSAASNLPVGTVPTQPVLVGTITESSNTPYTVAVASNNGFVLTNGSESIQYDLYYGGNIVSADGQISGGSSVASVKDLEVKWDTAATEAGTFSDTLTFTITATN